MKIELSTKAKKADGLTHECPNEGASTHKESKKKGSNHKRRIDVTIISTFLFYGPIYSMSI